MHLIGKLFDAKHVIALVNNFFGRQFISLNDVAVNPRNKQLYFTDVPYGYFQDFRPLPGTPNQVYKFNATSGLVSVIADGFSLPNGTSLCVLRDTEIS